MEIDLFVHIEVQALDLLCGFQGFLINYHPAFEIRKIIKDALNIGPSAKAGMESVSLEVIKLIHAEVLVHDNFVERAFVSEKFFNQSQVAARGFDFFFEFTDNREAVLVVIIRRKFFNQMRKRPVADVMQKPKQR